MPHEGGPGRPPIFSDAAIQFCLSIKVLFKLPLRQTAGMVASLLRLSGRDWPVPDYSTLCRRQKTLKVQIPYRRADGPLNLLVDSTGIKFLGDGEWQAWKHGVQGRRQWRKVHLAMDTATSDIRAVEFTGVVADLPENRRCQSGIFCTACSGTFPNVLGKFCTAALRFSEVQNPPSRRVGDGLNSGGAFDAVRNLHLFSMRLAPNKRCQAFQPGTTNCLIKENLDQFKPAEKR
ncbi:Transposase DDE domain-containing protein [Roseicitreum antarcticum]|uniref:Transposase DDE domain-containing protein n=1 Tax=Roseicitreum antarcticum TaxID=564137 RepID=A0A1H3DDD0_9RHOB|nr:Transposase DDE domain-containing protein [Roseicitreum antarcticum]